MPIGEMNKMAKLFVVVGGVMLVLLACSSSSFINLPPGVASEPSPFNVKKFQDPYLILDSLIMDVTSGDMWKIGDCLARGPGGEWLVLSPEAKRKKLLVYKNWKDTTPAQTLDCPLQEDLFSAGGFIGKRVALIPFAEPVYDGKEMMYPCIQNRDSLEELKSLPAAGMEGSRSGLETLGSGHSLVEWKGLGYEFDPDSKQTKPVDVWPLNFDATCGGWSSIPVGNDGLFYVSRRHLFEMHKGDKKPTPHLKSSLVAAVSSGPVGAVLIQLEKPELRSLDTGGASELEVVEASRGWDFGLIYFPADRKLIHLKHNMFKDMKFCQKFFWSPSSKKLFVLSGDKLFSIDVDEVLKYPREAIQ